MADPSAAIEAARAVIGCVSHARPLLSVQQDRDGFVATRFLTDPAPLTMAEPLRGCGLAVTDSVHIPNGSTGGTFSMVAYRYALLDRDGIELLAFHWHPEPRFSAPVRPHVHVSAALRPRQANGERGLVPLDKRHLPTGRVSLGDVVAMLIEEFGAEPRVADWRGRLATAGPPGA